MKLSSSLFAAAAGEFCALENAAKRVVLLGLSFIRSTIVLSPNISAASAEATAATVGSPPSLTCFTASAVFVSLTVLKLCCEIYPLHWASACGWLITVFIVSTLAPSSPTRL